MCSPLIEHSQRRSDPIPMMSGDLGPISRHQQLEDKQGSHGSLCSRSHRRAAITVIDIHDQQAEAARAAIQLHDGQPRLGAARLVWRVRPRSIRNPQDPARSSWQVLSRRLWSGASTTWLCFPSAKTATSCWEAPARGSTAGAIARKSEEMMPQRPQRHQRPPPTAGRSKSVVALLAAGRPIRPVWHAAGILGESMPVFKPWWHRAAGGKQDLLISSQQMSEAVALAFARGHGEHGEHGGGSGGGDQGEAAEVVVSKDAPSDGNRAAAGRG